MNNRRNFLKLVGATSAGLALSNPLSAYSMDKNRIKDSKIQRFNMSGYSAPPMKTVRIGFIGLGNRGPSSLRRLTLIEGVEIKAICDIRPESLQKGQKVLARCGMPPAVEYGKNEDDWKNMCNRDDIDLIYQVTPWKLHVPVSVYAMENGKHAAVEVPAAQTIEDCWKLVETSERTRKHCMMLENCCYDFFELLVLNMVRQGVFGEIINAEASYIHNQIEIAFEKNHYPGMWLLKESQHRNGNHYPTHGLGPVAQAMNINRGDRFLNMVSMQSNDFSYGPRASKEAKSDPFYKEFDTHSYRGNMNTSIIKTGKGKTILVQHDVSSPRVYTRKYIISGTLATAQKYPLPARISFSSKNPKWISPEEMAIIEKKYMPQIVKVLGEKAKKVGGHGGMDFMMDWRLIDCLRNGLPLDEDVYDAAAWSSIGPLSELSVANNSKLVEIPDFTCGSYKTNKPVDLEIKAGGTTGVRTQKN